MKKHFDIFIEADFRNTGFVFLILKKARQLGINGRAGYNSSGEVIIEAEGSDEKVEMLLDFCANYPDKNGYVDPDIKQGIMKNYKQFEMNIY